MATQLSKTILSIIYSALRKVNGYSDGEIPSPEKVEDALFTLNYIINDFENDELYFLDTRERTRTFRDSDHVLVGSTYYRCHRMHTSPNVSTRADSTAYSVGDLVIPATANGYYYRCTTAGTSDSSEPTMATHQGETVTDGTVTWTTHADSAPGTGKDWTTYWTEVAAVATYTSYARNTQYFAAGDFELLEDEYAISEAYVTYNDDSHPILIVSNSENKSLADQTTEGLPFMLSVEVTGTYDRLCHLRYHPDQVGDEGYVLHYLARVRHTNYTSSSITLDFPDNWHKAFVYLLAAELAPEYSLSLEERQLLRIDAEAAKMRAMGRDTYKTNNNGIEPLFNS